MRTSVAFASLLLLLLAATSHGIRLERQLREAINNDKKKMVVSPTSGGEAPVVRSVNKRCGADDEHCASGSAKKAPLKDAESNQMRSSTGNGRTTTVLDADATTPQAGRRGSDYQGATAATPTRVPWQRQTTYADIMDIAGMDYSPATRRSPIHN